MAMTQAESYADLWAAHRDQARPVTPADVWGLREDRHFQPPSKAHLKRLARIRPVVVVAKAKPPSAPDPVVLRHNQAVTASMAVRAAARAAATREAFAK
jgi:hypothetical protein